VSYFDLLVLAFAALAVVALYLVRPATFVLAGNNLLVARAFAAIDRGGPPWSMGYLPTHLFAPDNLTTAATILTIMLVALVTSTLLVTRHVHVRIRPDAPAVPKSVLIVIGLYLAAYAGARSTIFSGGYMVREGTRYDLELAGGHAFLCSLVLYELARRRLLGTISARKAFLMMFFIFAVIGYAKGGTGLTTGYLVASAILLLPRTGSTRRFANMSRIGAVLLGVLALSFVVRGVRSSLAEEGGEAVGNFVDSILAMEQQSSETGEGAESVANATQSATHMVMCIDLYDRGLSREWRSIYGVVEYTFIPSFLAPWFGWTRSIEPAWELMGHYIHGGGINVLGEFYWNGGYLCVLIMCAVLALFCSLVDTRYRASPFWLMIIAQFAPSFLMGYGYGFPQVARGAINGLVATVAYLAYAVVSKQPSFPRATSLAVDASHVAGQETTVGRSLA
jgi:hypothetical protein